MTIDFFANGLCFYCQLAKNELDEYSDFHARTEFTWKQQNELLEEELIAILERHPEADRDDIVGSYAWDLHVHQHKYPNIHRTALVVTIYAFLEDQLNGLCETLTACLDTNIKLADLSGQGIERALLFLFKVAGFDLGRISTLSFVRNVARLRNRMVHAGGILPKNADDKLNKFIQATLGLDGPPGGYANIRPEFIGHLFDRFGNFFDELDSQVQKFIQNANTRSNDA